MSAIPLFINLPIAPSLSKALIALEREGYFTIHLVKFDVDILKLMIASRPCATIFSITDEASYTNTFEMLENLKRLHAANGEFARQPALRMILLAEHWGVTLERWMELGIHEFIPAPIAKKALNFKLNRHYGKALSSIAAARGEAPADPFAQCEEEVLVKGSDADSPPGRQTFYIPGGGDGTSGLKKHERIVIFASTPLLGTGLEVWTPVPDSTGFEETWVAVIPGRGKGPDAPNEAVFFTGDKPVYDKDTSCWIFRGEAPKLVHRNTDSTIIDPNLFSCSADRTKIFVKDSGSFSKFEIKHQSAEELTKPAPRPFFISGAEGVKKPYAVSPAKDIADFLDSWKPKNHSDEPSERASSRIHGSGGGHNEDDKAAPGPRKSSSEAPLPGHYSGPGMRANEPEFNSRVTPEPGKPENQPSATRRVHGAAGLQEEPIEPEPEWPHEPVTPSEESRDPESEDQDLDPAEDGDHEKKTEADIPETQGPYRQLEAQDGAEAQEKPRQKSNGDPRKTSKAHGKPGQKGKKPTPRMSFPIFEADEKPKELRALSAGSLASKSNLARIKKGESNETRETAKHISKDESDGGFRNLNDEAVMLKSKDLKVKSEKTDSDGDVHIKHDAPEGSLTWSMQSEEAGATAKVRKKLGLTDDGGRPFAAPDSKAPPDRQHESEDAEMAATGSELTSPSAAAGPVPGGSSPAAEPTTENPPIKDESWLETVRRVLARIFS